MVRFGRACRGQEAGQRGFALLIVLGAMALLALLGTRVTSAGRTEILIAGNLRDASEAEAAADGAVHLAVFNLLDRPPRRWAADGLVRRVTVPGAVVDLRIDDPRGRLNPNSAPPVLTAALIREVGGDLEQAGAIAAAVFDWRTPGIGALAGGTKLAQYQRAGRSYGPPGRPFGDIDELGAVLGMTPGLLAALRPHLSLVNFATIEPARATPHLVRALQRSGIGQPAMDETATVVEVRARALTDRGARFTRQAAILLRAGAEGRPYRVLSWLDGED